MKKIVFLFLLFLVVYSCTKDKKATITATNVQTTDISALTAFLAKSFRVNKDSIVYYKDVDKFYIEHDMILSRKNAETRYKAGIPSLKSVKALQYYVGFVVDPSLVTNIKIRSTVSTDWTNALQSAISNWNALATPVHFQIVGSGSYDLTVDDNIGNHPTWVASTDVPNLEMFANYLFPSSGMHINTSFNDSTFLFKVAALTHELGHVVGFLHTDGGVGTLVPGTAGSDYFSFINAVLLGDWNGFSDSDLEAINYLYPSPPIPLTVSGQDVICLSSTGNYTINAPFGTTVNWFISGTAGTVPANSTGNSVWVTGVGTGDFSVSATVTGNYKTYTVTAKKVRGGNPTATWIGLNGTLCKYNEYPFSISSPGSTVSSITCKIGTSTVPVPVETAMTPTSPGYYTLPENATQINVTLVNSCGSSSLIKAVSRPTGGCPIN